MINKVLKVIEEHTVLDKDLQKVIKAEYPYKETLASDIDDLFALYIVNYRRELLVAMFEKMTQQQVTMLEIGDYEKLADELLSN